MAIIQELDLTGIQNPQLRDGIRSIMAREFWNWFHQHQDDKVTTIKVWFLSKTVRVRDLRQIFVMLFGEPV